jgi:hypothetical protein
MITLAAVAGYLIPTPFIPILCMLMYLVGWHFGSDFTLKEFRRVFKDK